VLKAYADENVSFAVVQSLRKRGMDVITVSDRNRQGADDASLLAESLANQRILLTNDQDFLSLAASAASQRVEFAPIFYWPQQQRRVGVLVNRIIATIHGVDWLSRVESGRNRASDRPQSRSDGPIKALGKETRASRA
jgi:hypothetical protein